MATPTPNTYYFIPVFNIDYLAFSTLYLVFSIQYLVLCI